ncbi:MAG: hypothetical protein A3J09_01170 [Candidatus Zambryskibacteria bacterium RIFCSPLOWO2_02_FULL_51_21]|uniref:Ada DNA repair metal-binding domain-containing protein n=1 Tax=Candidatus Zambryskibacteria bacterium RIFCSPHIGHO2_02_FULL_43_37 TaxID=1802749 RepID=A0A1G2TGZ3_9BACT|nr:MAG: hypothetical protein A2723_01170 [Candidatus Zambryskibacteria bacterium RIFCSPHIGHO2_01_FULL_52_18]OHA96574.1 MAG: hypothetical protein A3D49_01730 [Candidatus Zambryskibacteria bacterium RIFCSPHIGHO2_02_FULL_43_37]OHB07624.1 MAG: hypothetical protein A2944_00755 [Candidatus Zambryskibacteria bacterium RIFCSPLOWO2_01_FULL_52_12]OHB11162.1 MAG: hypothetical protein A3J09_01170 [Candidatus Zambryskibacteria bacterium RIFCSPLOWO2_02_FULL_51_21]
MSVTEEVTFDNSGRIERFPWARKFYLSAVIMLVALFSFALGKLSAGDNRGEAVRIEYDPNLSAASAITAVSTSKTSVVASKNGKKYHYPSCPGAKQIAEANKIVFASAEAAEASGYTLASNCTKP